MPSWPPAVSDFKAQFTREFIYGDGGLDSVGTNDIQRALNEANSLFNQSLFNSATDQLIAYLYLAAHRLWCIINQAGGLSAVPRGRGVRSGTEGIVLSKAVGQVNVNYQPPPERIANNPSWAALWTSPFGQHYLSMVEPATAGPFAVAVGPNPNQWNDE